jgi:cytochrome P450
VTTTMDLDAIDFGLQALPGDSLHAVLRAYRERGPVQPTRFLGLPAFVITSHKALEEAFLDEHAFPGHRMYQASFEPAIGKSFISDPDPASHLLFRKLSTPAFRSRAVASYEQTGLAAPSRTSSSIASPAASRTATKSTSSPTSRPASPTSSSAACSACPGTARTSSTAGRSRC